MDRPPRPSSHDSLDEEELEYMNQTTNGNGNGNMNGNGIGSHKILPPLSTGDISPPPGYSEESEEDRGSPTINGHSKPPAPPRRQSSFAQSRPNGTPRTPNRVRFNISPIPSEPNQGLMELADEEALFREMNDLGGAENQRQPLLTGSDAPMVAMAMEDEDDFNAEELLESARPKSGMSSAFMNMANSIIGAGIIGQPYAFRQAGLITGIILLVALTITVDWTIRLIVINSKLSGANSFQATMEHCFGKWGLIAISVAQWAFAFGGMIAFCIIVGDTIPHVMIYLFPSLPDMHFLWLLTNRRAVIVLLIMGVSFPLSLYRDIAKLSKASTLALISMLIIIAAVILQGAELPTELRGSIHGSLFIESGVFQAIGVISFAFVCHHNSLLIYGSLRKPTIDRFSRVTHYSTFISMLACLSMALAGFLTFGDLTQGNVLNNFPTSNLLINLARLCFGLNMLTTLPLECFVCREVIENYYYPGQPFEQKRHLAITSALVVAAMGISLMTCDLGVVFEFVGATSACALAYILPPMCYIKLSKRTWRVVLPAGACIAFGAFVMVVSVSQSVVKLWRGETTSTSCS